MKSLNDRSQRIATIAEQSPRHFTAKNLCGHCGFALLAGISLAACLPDAALAQAGLRESLERLDKNQNGYIEPDEITPLARPYLERISRNNRSSLSRPTPISEYQQSARIYYAMQNGISGVRVEPEVEFGVKGFGTDRGEPVIPGFGIGDVPFPYTEDDLQEAERTLRSFDRNDDGFLDAQETARARWSHRNPFDDDLDKDGRLSKLELAQRYARRRMVQTDVGEMFRKFVRTGGEIKSSVNRDSDNDRNWYRNGSQATYLTFNLLGRFDRNRDGYLEGNEATGVGIPLTELDADRDGRVSRDELYASLSSMYEDVGEEAAELPTWFFERDKDKDGQISLKEFAVDWTTDQLTEFADIDANNDGLLTKGEVLASIGSIGGTYQSEEGQILSARRTVISEIEVEEDITIGKLTVELSITHSNVGWFDGFLISPDGDMIELFTDVGGSGNNFEQTRFSDDAPIPITKVKPPFTGTFKPEAVEKKQPSLSTLSGKSTRGIWQLMIRGTRNERAGMLHYWTLDIEGPGETDTEAKDGGDKAEEQPADERRRPEGESRDDGEGDRNREGEPGGDRRSRFFFNRGSVSPGEVF